jgi:hypothetical protein
MGACAAHNACLAAEHDGRPSQGHDATLDQELSDWYISESRRPRIALLGRVEVRTGDDNTPHRDRLHTELVTYLATKGHWGATRQQIENALWDGRPVSSGSLRTVTCRTRRWLGFRPDGQPWLSKANVDDRRYTLVGAMVDWDLFRRLRDRAETPGDHSITDLYTALAMVRGTPLQDADRPYGNRRRPFHWLVYPELQPSSIAATISDTAHRLATLLLHQRRYHEARWAVTRGWLADPERNHDELWIDLIQTEHATGHPATARRLLVDLAEARDAVVTEDLPTATYRLLITRIPDLIRR